MLRTTCQFSVISISTDDYPEREKMDKLTIISGILFLLADISAIISIAMPDWIITDVGGNCGDYNLFFFTSPSLVAASHVISLR